MCGNDQHTGQAGMGVTPLPLDNGCGGRPRLCDPKEDMRAMQAVVKNRRDIWRGRRGWSNPPPPQMLAGPTNGESAGSASFCVSDKIGRASLTQIYSSA